MTDKDVLVHRILANVVPECYYERMLGERSDGIDSAMSYNEFFLYNKGCLEDLSHEDLSWVSGLCNRLNRGNCIGMMDMEDCGIWNADSIFYDLDRKLVLVHPR